MYTFLVNDKYAKEIWTTNDLDYYATEEARLLDPNAPDIMIIHWNLNLYRIQGGVYIFVQNGVQFPKLTDSVAADYVSYGNAK